MKKLLTIVDKVEKPVAINEAVSLSINANSESSADVVDMLQKIMGLSGMKPVTPDMITQTGPQKPMVQTIADVGQFADEAAKTYADEMGEEYENQPDETYKDISYMTKDIAGGLNKPHQQFKKEYPGDNPMAVKEELLKEYASFKADNEQSFQKKKLTKSVKKEDGWLDTAKNWASSAADTVGQGFDAALGTQSPVQKYVRDPLVKAGIANPDTMSWKDGKSPYVEPTSPAASVPGPVPRNITGKNAPVGYFDADNVKTDPSTNTTTVFKDPGSTPAQPKNMQQWLYGTGPTPVKPVTPLPKSDNLNVSAMPDMDLMTRAEKAAAANAQGTSAFTGMPTKSAPASTQGTKAFTGMPTQSAPPPRIKVPSIPADMGMAKADTPVGSMPAAPGPASYTVKSGDNISKVLQGMGINPTPANIQQVAKLSGIKDPNFIKPNQVLKIPGLKERSLSESRNSKFK